MTLIERGICKITALNSNGLGVGVAETSGDLVEIPRALPDEIVCFEKHFYRNKIFFYLSEVIRSSKYRTDPPCKYFGICGGCSLQHLKTDYYLHHKVNLLQQLLTNAAIKTYISQIKTIGPASRRRAVFEAVKKHDQLFLGFKKFQSDKIVNIDNCLVLLPELSQLIKKLKYILLELLENKSKCKIIVTKADNGIVLTLEANSPNFLCSTQKLNHFCKENSIIKLTIIDNNKWQVLYLEMQPYVSFEGVKVPIESDSFLQVSPLSDHIITEMLNNIFEKIISHLSPGNNEKFEDNLLANLQIVDLFCGRGTLTIPAAKFGPVDGFESEKSAVKTLRDGLRDKAAHINIYQRNLFTNPLTWSELNKYDLAIINPPRAGAKEQASILGSSTVKTIIYLSCNPESFARDAKLILRENKYILEEITPIDQFYWSHHLEILGIFKAQSR